MTITSGNHQTRAVRLSDVPEALHARLLEHAEQRHLDLSDVQCWLTHSENPLADGLRGRLFRRRATASPDAESHVALVLHPTWALIGSHGERGGSAVLSAPYHDLSVTPGYGLRSALGADEGITVTGFVGADVGVASPGSYFLGLGPPDGPDASQALTERIAASR